MLTARENLVVSANTNPVEQSGRGVRGSETTMQTTIQVNDGKIIITGPYSETNNQEWRQLGGKFAGGDWVLPDNDTVRATIVELFGSKSDEVDALVTVTDIPYTGGQIVQIGGYVLAQRRGRDYRVQMPEDVSLEAGSFRSSGGSHKNPRVALDPDVVFRLRCRRSFAETHRLEIAPAAQASKIEI